jgi:Carboxylesterase family
MGNLRSILLFAFLIVLFSMNSCSKDNSPGTNRTPQPQPQVLYNIPFATNTDWQGRSQELQMDIFLPAQIPGKKYPLIMFIHGGIFLEGSRTDAATRCAAFADSGFIGVTIDYRLGWDTGQGGCTGDTTQMIEAVYRSMQDANAALRFLVSKADEYNIDTSSIFIGGASAGGDVALQTTYINNNYAQTRFPKEYNKLGSLTDAGNALKNTFSIKGVCTISSILVDSNVVNQQSGVPSIFFHGALDNVAPINYGSYLGCPNYPMTCGSLCIYRQLRRYNVPAIAHVVANGSHGDLDKFGVDEAFTTSEIVCFFRNLMFNKANINSGIYVGTQSSCQ